MLWDVVEVGDDLGWLFPLVGWGGGWQRHGYNHTRHHQIRQLHKLITEPTQATKCLNVWRTFTASAIFAHLVVTHLSQRVLSHLELHLFSMQVDQQLNRHLSSLTTLSQLWQIECKYGQLFQVKSHSCNRYKREKGTNKQKWAKCFLDPAVFSGRWEGTINHTQAHLQLLLHAGGPPVLANYINP